MTPHVTILLVDEEPLLRRATALLLAERGGKVSAVATIDEAIALTRQRLFDVGVIDIAPGGPSPADVYKEIQEGGLVPTRMVVCACPPVTPVEIQPFAAVLLKPYVFEHLLAAIFGRRERPRFANGASSATNSAAPLDADAANDIDPPPPSTHRIAVRRGAYRDPARIAPIETRRPLKLGLRGSRRAMRARRGRA